MDKWELIEKLIALDEDAALLGYVLPVKHQVVIVGGSAFLLQDLTSRPTTYDVDVLQANSTIRSLLANYPEINCQSEAYVNCVPYNFEDRLERVELETVAIAYCTPSTEDLAVMKLYRYEDNDRQDLTTPEFLNSLDWDVLDGLVYDPNEALASRISEQERDREYGNLVHNYLCYRREYGSCG